MSFVRVNGRKFQVPGSAPIRVVVGFLLLVGGVLGFLPVLGFWMIPLGIIILSVDLHSVRRLRRRFEVRWGRWRQRRSGDGV
ncbi:MAG: hypothetical protein JJ939_11665 [Alphaproteobacteria bacterium]|nr:hypothetical protein [Rhodobiaceae bacterium]MBO6542219.1 hypothetical protein [Alphaproteobacteria bacterium]MBO6629072.1 hypothetical protein [Alphaproteobacteria bacterium]MDF1624925.1 PGPGW domain-containing protein [Parvibaculaceae bacterium]